MNQEELSAFPLGVAEKLQTYVYRLIDPRDGETFYVGKGRGDRVFAHIREQVGADELADNKLKADSGDSSGRLRSFARDPSARHGRYDGFRGRGCPH